MSKHSIAKPGRLRGGGAKDPRSTLEADEGWTWGTCVL